MVLVQVDWYPALCSLLSVWEKISPIGCKSPAVCFGEMTGGQKGGGGGGGKKVRKVTSPQNWKIFCNFGSSHACYRVKAQIKPRYVYNLLVQVSILSQLL